MVQHAIADSEPVWAHPGGLTDLLDYLRLQGFEITANEYAVSHELLVALIDRGVDVRDREVVRSHLGPLLCTSAREQASFPSHFDRWERKHVAESTSSDETAGGLEQESRSWLAWRWILALICVIAAISLVVFFRPRWLGTSQPAVQIAYSDQPQGSSPNQPQPISIRKALSPFVNIAIAASLSVLLTAFAWGLWSFYRGRLFLKRRPVTGEPDLLTIRLESRLPVSVQTALRRIAFQMRRRRAIPSLELDIARTTEATVRRAGRFTPEFAPQYVQPEYVFVIDRRSFNDQGAQYLDELSDELIGAQVLIERYYFDEDPRILTPEKPGQAITLYELCATSQDRRVLVFADSASLIDPVGGEIAVWTQALRTLREAALFTPKPTHMWGSIEQRAKQVLGVYPATLQSIEKFVLTLGGTPSASREMDWNEGPFPMLLASHMEQWLERNPPDAEVVEDVLGSIRRWLGPDGYFWLAACAAYPEIRFNLTEYLGSTLRGTDDLPLFTVARFTALSRLPWMRVAYMPDWLRLRLLNGLDQEQNGQVREALNALWLSAATGHNRVIELEVARRTPLTKSMTKAFFRALRRRSNEHSVLRDRVFASVMLGRSLEPLAIRIPRIWRQWTRSRELEEFPETTAQRWIWRCFIFVEGTLAVVGLVLSIARVFFYRVDTYFTGPGAGLRYSVFEASLVSVLGGAILGLLGGLVSLRSRLLWASWLLVAAILPCLFGGAFIGMKVAHRITASQRVNTPRPRPLQTKDKAYEQQQVNELERRREMSLEYATRRRSVMISQSVYFLVALISLSAVTLTVKQTRKVQSVLPWYKLHIRILVWATFLGEVCVPGIILWYKFHPERDDAIAFTLLGIHIVGILAVFPGIQFRSRPLISQGVVTAASPVAMLLVGSVIPERFWTLGAACWAVVFLGQTLWVARLLGASPAVLGLLQNPLRYRGSAQTTP